MMRLAWDIFNSRNQNKLHPGGLLAFFSYVYLWYCPLVCFRCMKHICFIFPLSFWLTKTWEGWDSWHGHVFLATYSFYVYVAHMKKVSGGMECVFIHDIVLSQLSCDFFFAGFFLPGIGHESQLAEFGVENKVKNLGGVWGVFPVFSFWGTLCTWSYAMLHV